ncbi:MAG: hypothetical protein ACREHG_00725 [Candidatus Saccharimonadales bacterium]
MKYIRLPCKGLYVNAMLMLYLLLPHNAIASSSMDKAFRFGICPSNIKSVLVTKEVKADIWHLMITLNSVGTEQFRDLQEKHFDKPVELAWDGVSFGKRQLNLAGLADAKQLLLQSRGWLSLHAAEAQMKLLGDKSFDVPCGPTN